MLRALLVVENAQRADLLLLALRDAHYEVMLETKPATDWVGQVRTLLPDVVVVDCKSPDSTMLAQVALVTNKLPRPIVLFTENDDRHMIQAAVRAGESCA